MRNAEERMPPWGRSGANEISTLRDPSDSDFGAVRVEAEPKAANERSDGALVGRDPMELPLGFRADIPRSGKQVAEGMLNRILRGVRQSTAKSPASQMAFRASKMSAALDQQRRDASRLGIDKRAGSYSGNRRLVQVTEAFVFGEHTFYVDPFEILSAQMTPRRGGSDSGGDCGVNGIAVRSGAQQAQLDNSQYLRVRMNFIHPSHPSVVTAHGGGVRDAISLRSCMRAVHELAETGSTLSSEEMCARLKDAVSLLPNFLSPQACGASRSCSSDAEAGAPTVVGAGFTVEVPSTINVSSITTASALRAYVECKRGGVLLWGGAKHVQLRKNCWGANFLSENRKINQILSAYCFILFTQLTGDLPNKQELGKKARASIEQLAGDYARYYNASLGEKYFHIYDKGGWYEVAVTLNSAAATS